jgi:predicted transcriptional regulator
VVRLTSEELLTLLAALGHLQRLRIIGELAGGRVHVSELARRLELSRPLLYMHLDRLEKAQVVMGSLELSADGKAMKYFQLAPLELRVTTETILGALREDQALVTHTDDASTRDTDKEKPT